MPSKSYNFSNDEQTEFNGSRPPSYNLTNEFGTPPPSFSKTKQADLNLDDDLGLPSVPDNHPVIFRNQNNNIDDQAASIEFDDLTKRFQNLKSMK